MGHYQLYEWESRRFDSDQAIPVAEAEKLVRAASAQESRLAGNQRAFDFGHYALTARNLVGLVSAGDTTCEILPKVDRDAQGDATALRRQLVRMLGVAHDVPVADDAPAATDTQNETLLEVLIARFISMLEVQARRGIPRSYVMHSDDLSALRGRLNVTRQFTNLATSPHRLACHYDEFSIDIAINQAIKAAVMRLQKLTRALANRRRLGELALLYADVSTIAPSQLPWHAMASGRNTSPWMPLIRFAKLLLGEHFQNSNHGATEGFSLLFDMNVLFERYVERLLRTTASHQDLQLKSQSGRRACLHPEEEGSGIFETIPDIQLCRNECVEWILDTKWKRLADPADDKKMGISESDVYQVMAYAQIYRCDRIVLLYPYHGGLASKRPIHHRVAHKDGTVRLTIATVDLQTQELARRSLAALFD